MRPEDHPLLSLVLHKFSRGGSDRVAAYLARGFADAGFRTELVVFGCGGEVEQVLVDLLGDVPVRYLGRASKNRVLDLVRGFPRFVRHLRQGRPDVVISTANNTALVSGIGLWIAGVSSKLVLKTTNPVARSRHRGLVRLLRSWSYARLFRRTQQVWTLSDDETRELAEEYPRFADRFQAIVQPYVTPSMLAPAPKRLAQKSKVLLSVARLTKQKRLDHLIAAFAHVKTPDTRLIICGEGEERASLTALVEELGLGKRVEMPGYIADVSRVFCDADLLVMTSEYEGLPAAALEAMGSNCPVLSTDCFPSARSLLETAPGCAIIDDLSPGALGAQLDRMLSNPRPTGLDRIAAFYSVSNGVESHVAKLRALIADSPSVSSQRSGARLAQAEASG